MSPVSDDVAQGFELLERAIKEAREDLDAGNKGRGVRRVHALHHRVDRLVEKLEGEGQNDPQAASDTPTGDSTAQR